MNKENEKELENRIIENLSSGILVYSSDLKLKIFNKIAKKIMPVIKDPGSGMNIIDPDLKCYKNDGTLMNKEEYPEKKILETGHQLRGFIYGIKKEHESDITWILLDGNPVFDKKGKLLEIIVNFSDITDRKKADDYLRKSEETLRIAQRIAHLGSWHMELATGEVVWSEVLYRIYGYDPALPPPLYSDSMKLFTPESWEKLSSNIASTSQTGIPYELELETVNNDGSHGWMWARGELVRDEDGNPIRLQGVVMDITERKIAEKKLRESEQKFKIMNDNSPLAIYVSTGIEQKAVYINPTFTKLFGYTLEDVPDVSRWWPLAYPDEKYRKKIEEEWQRKVEAAIRTKSSIEPMEVVVTCKDGSKKNILWSYVSTDIQNWAFGLDLTDTKEAEKELREKEERLALATQKNGVGVWDWNLLTQEMIWDDSMYSLYHIRREDFSGTEEAWRKSLHPDDLERGDREVEAAIKGEKPFDTEFRVIWPDGEVRHIKAIAKVFRDKNNKPVRMLGINNDITERKKAEEMVKELNRNLERRIEERTAQLEAANSELEAFSYSVSHDLRTPLRALDGFSSILLEDYSEILDDEGKRLLNVLRENTARMGKLIEDILKFSRTGRFEMTMSDIDMTLVAQDVYRELLNESENQPKVKINPLPSSHGDLAMIRQVFVNLLSNAIKFCKEKSDAQIEIGSFKEESENVYFVKDNGAGFDMKYVDKLFGVFQRLHSDSQFEGTGIGLAIVKRIISRHGGKVWAEGKVNEGATIYFTLPE